MLHTLKKCISNRGSALFMVISTMTALLVSVTAMYFSMVTSRQAQYAMFNQVQADQTAQSVMSVVKSEILKALIADVDPAAEPAAAKELYEKLKTLNEGEAISTDANGFKALDPANNAAANTNDLSSQLGAYGVTITYVGENEEGARVYDITVVSAVDGTQSALHSRLTAIDEDGKGKGSFAGAGDSEIFAATGYTPNDTYVDSGFFLTNTFFDTEYTYVGMFQNSSSVLAGNLSTGGSLILNNDFNTTFNTSQINHMMQPTYWSIRGDMRVRRNSALKFNAGSKIMVGGDLIYDNCTGSGFESATSGGVIDVYVLGDVIFNSKPDNFGSCNLYIQGDLKFEGVSSFGPTFNTVHVNGDIIGAENVTVNIKSGGKKKWDSSSLEANGMTIPEVEEELGYRTKTMEYGKWVIDDTLVNYDKPVKVRLNNTNAETEGVPGYTTVFTLKYKDQTGVTVDNSTNTVTGKGFTIDGFEGRASNWNHGMAVIIDTGDDPNVAVPIRLKPYLDDSGANPGTKVFSWVRVGQYGEAPGRGCFNIIVKGRGTVIFDVEKGATYKDLNYQQVMHYSWFKLLGGEEKIDEGSYTYRADNFHTQYKSVDAIDFMHLHCKPGDGCSYTTELTTDVCENCGSAMYSIICAKHHKVSSYCPSASCADYRKAKLDAFNAGTGEGLCNNHIDEAKVDSYLSAHASDTTLTVRPDGSVVETDLKTAMSDSTGKFIYPNTNIYFNACDEESEIRFSTVGSRRIEDNGIFGFIYAPFMTYRAEDNKTVGAIRLHGGMIVSDYRIADNYAFDACYPDRMPREVAKLSGGGKFTSLGGKAIKSWKLTIGRYR